MTVPAISMVRHPMTSGGRATGIGTAWTDAGTIFAPDVPGLGVLIVEYAT